MSQKAKKIIDTTVKIVWWVLLVLLIALIVCIVSAKIKGKVPKVFGYSVVMITTESMGDTFPVGTYILIKETSPEDIKENDYVLSEATKHFGVIDSLINNAGISLHENNFMDDSELPDPAAALTQEDKIYLAMKWGKLYKPSEWVELEKDYVKMKQSFDIQDADSENTLVLLCKTNLKANQAIDCGDIEGFQKLSKVSESLRKSAKFTAQ